MPIEQVYEQAHTFNMLNNPPMSDDEVYGIVASIYSKHLRDKPQTLQSVPTEPQEAAAKPEPDNKLAPQPFTLGDPAALPKREFVYSTPIHAAS